MRQVSEQRAGLVAQRRQTMPVSEALSVEKCPIEKIGRRADFAIAGNRVTVYSLPEVTSAFEMLNPSMRIVLCYPVDADHIRQIQAAAPDAEVIDAGQERVNELLPTADLFIGHAKVPVDWDRVLAAKRLRWIQSSAAGLDHCLVPGVIDSDIVVCSASGLFAPQVAEQTFALMLGLLRSLPAFFRAEAKREFIRLPTDDLRGKTVGIVGLGGNGRMIAKLLAPWELRIIATDYFPIDKPAEVDQLWPAEDLDRLLGESDIVILALPLNANTRGTI